LFGGGEEWWRDGVEWDVGDGFGGDLEGSVEFYGGGGRGHGYWVGEG